MGAHRKQTAPAGAAVLLAVAATAATCAPPAYADVPAADLGPIVHCESGGNPTAHNPASTASGLYQFLTSTWLRYGGGEFAPTAAQATPAQQTAIANRAYAANGLADWAASRGCWGSHLGEILGGHSLPDAVPARKPAPKPAPKPVAPAASSLAADLALPAAPAPPPPKQTPPPAAPTASTPAAVPSAVEATGATHVVQPGDTLWGIAPAHEWPALYQRNKAAVGNNPDLIFPGQRLRL